MGHGDYSSLTHCRVAHQRIFQIDGADPLASGLDQVFAAVYQLDAAVGIDRCDVAGTEPSICGPAVTRVRSVVITPGHPGSANFELAHGLPIPCCFTAFTLDAYVDKRRRPALFT